MMRPSVATSGRWGFAKKPLAATIHRPATHGYRWKPSLRTTCASTNGSWGKHANSFMVYLTGLLGCYEAPLRSLCTSRTMHGVLLSAQLSLSSLHQLLVRLQRWRNVLAI